MSALRNRKDVTTLFFPFCEEITALYRPIYLSNFVNVVGVVVTAQGTDLATKNSTGESFSSSSSRFIFIKT